MAHRESLDINVDFDAPIDRAGTGSYKWDKYAGRDVIPLWVADMDFRSPQPVTQALHDRVEHGVFGYGQAPEGLQAAVRHMLASRYGWEVSAEWLVWLPGLVSGLNVVCRAVGKRGDEVATFTPVYPPFLSAPALAERTLSSVPLIQRHSRWEIDFGALEAALSPRCRLLLFCSPHNPVGRSWSAEELTVLADVVRRHHLIVASDEIHADLVLDEDTDHLPLAKVAPDLSERLITLMAPSKTYNIPGLGCSFAVVPDPDLRAAMQRTMEGIVPHVNVLGYAATQAAYEHGEPWRQKLLAYLRGNRDLVQDSIAHMPGLEMGHVEATYLAWIDAGASGIREPARFFEERGVGLSDGTAFGAPGYVRLNFGCRRALLQQALERMAAALASRP